MSSAGRSPRSTSSRATTSLRNALAVLLLGAPGLLLVAPPAQAAATLAVPGDYATIQSALDAASPGDTVTVAPGSYPENLDFARKDVRLEATDGPGTTILAVPGGTGVTIGPGGVFTGFTVTGAIATFGAGMEISGDGTLVQGNVFDGNIGSAGGYGSAIGGNVSSPVIDGNVFRNNACDTQFLAGVVTFVNASNPRISNNVFEDNACRAMHLGLPNDGAVLVVNNTIVRNRTGITFFTGGVTSATQGIRNNLIIDNEVGVDATFAFEPVGAVLDHNDVFGNGTDYAGLPNQTGLNGNISADPAFVGEAGGDYRLQSVSPAVDAGSSVGAPATDLDRAARPVDGDGDGSADVDLGAYEFSASARAVSIDIRPGTADNRISRSSRGTVPVALLSGPDFAAPTQVDRTSLTFGRTGGEASLVRCERGGRDVNRDRLPDLVCAFRISATGFQVGDTVGSLRGSTRDGNDFAATDAVRIVR